MSAPTHIFDKYTDDKVTIDFLIRQIQIETCDPVNTTCANQATQWAVYKSGLWPMCRTHGKLGSGKGIEHVMAIIDKDGLHVADGDNIDDLLSTDDGRDRA